MSADIPQEKLGDWYFATVLGDHGWVAMAKREPFVGTDPIREPGQVWFSFGASRDDALAAVKGVVLE
jgi:hypothetical protein